MGTNANIGIIISDDELVLYILEGLGPEYEYVIVYLTNRSEALNLQKVKFAIHSQEFHIKAQNSVFTSDPVNSPMLNATLRGRGSSNNNNNIGGRRARGRGKN